MDTEKCKALLTAVHTGNLTEAARKLGYTPSGMSRMMDALEQETGFPLLYRSRSGVSPTAECDRLLPLIEELSRLGDLYKENAEAIQGLDIGDVRIGTAYPTYYSMIGKIAAEFSEKHPKIRIEIEEDYSSSLVQGVEEHRLDFCVISRRDGNFEWIPLPKDHMVAWVPASFPLSEGDRFPIKWFEKEPCIELSHSQDTDNARAFRACRITPNYTKTAMNAYSAAAMVEAGLGVTMSNALFTDTAGRSGVKVLRLDPEPEVDIGIAIAPKDQLSPSALKFREFTIRCMKEHAEWFRPKESTSARK